MHHLVEYFSAPVGDKCVGSADIYSIDWYIYMFIPEDVIDEVAAAADAICSVSSKDGYYLRKGNSMDNSQFHRNKRVCACDTFMNLKWVCLLMPRNVEREASTTPLLDLGLANRVAPTHES